MRAGSCGHVRRKEGNTHQTVACLSCNGHNAARAIIHAFDMADDLFLFLIHMATTALSLWVASLLFRGITFENKGALSMAAVLLGLANAFIRPVVIWLTVPLTVVTFGFFLLVINALMLMLVSSAVPGFRISGFWTAFFASIFISVLSFLVGLFIFQSGDNPIVIPSQHGLTFT